MRAATRRFALWQADLDGGLCAAPEEGAGWPDGRAEVTVVLDHREYGVTPRRRTFRAGLRHDVEWQLTGVEWPADVRPGVLATVTWQRSADAVTIRTTALEEPLTVDGVGYFHEYDPKVVTREYAPGRSNRGQVLYAVRHAGRVFEDGSAALEEAQLARRTTLGRGAKGAFLLRNAVDQLIREGFLTRVEGSVDGAGYPSYPAAAGQRPADLLFYAPLVEPAGPPGEAGHGDGEGGERRDHWVSGFVRRLPPGAHASERQRKRHEQAVEQEQIGPGEIAPGYTFVKRHHRGGQ